MAACLCLSDFDFSLPPELIAQHPAPERSASRLLDGRALPPTDRVFRDLPYLLEAGDLLVFNDTRVIKARLRGFKASGGAVEALIERVLPGHEVLAHLRASKSPPAGSRLHFMSSSHGPAATCFSSQGTQASWGPPSAFPMNIEGADHFEAEVLGRAGPEDSLFHLRFPADPFALLERHGRVPLPPYIAHDDDAEDERRYQTIFAARPGAAAAPTAALHFDEAVLAALRSRGVNHAVITLHVGAGTFQPVRTDNLAGHRMHSEWFDVPASTVEAITATRAAGGRVVCVGTTTLRALESAALGGTLRAGSRDTDIFIRPGFEFQVADLLVTNFHLPKSTLLMLVSALAGHEAVMALYRHAIEQRYRFFSYGDAMLLQRMA